MFTIELSDDDVVARLNGIVREMGDLTPLMRDIGEYLVDATKQRFMAGEAPDGSAWAPKSEATREKYSRSGESVSIRPLWGPSEELRLGIFAQATPDSVEVGSARPYAAMMQFGGTKSAFQNLWGDIPARPFIGLSDSDQEAILDTIDEWLQKAVDDFAR